jgi:hypothetical protein
MAVLTSSARSGILPPGTEQDSAVRPEFQGARAIHRNFFENALLPIAAARTTTLRLITALLFD